MPGFRITNIKCKDDLYKYKYFKGITDNYAYNDWHISRNTLDKFLEDKILYEDDVYIIILEGVSLNSSELIDRYGKENWKNTIIYMISHVGVEWFSELEGPVSGAVYYKNKDKWYIFTSKLGEKAIFYYCNNGTCVVGSQIKYLSDVLHEVGVRVVPDLNAIKHLMAYESLIGELLGIYEYCKFDYRQDDNPKAEDDYIKALDRSYKKALERILRKNNEYGYITVADISGGYDSRLNCYAIKALNAENVVMDCYSQTNSHDYRISSSIASELGYDYVFRALDNASCLKHIDDYVIMLNGASIYSGITGGGDMLHMLSGLDIGLEVTGLLGDVHDGSMVTNYCDGPIDSSSYRDSKTLREGVDYFFPKEENVRFENHVNEHFWFYNRGMICGMSSFFIRQHYTEAVTAFGDSEFVRTYLSIPWNMRVHGKLLRKWLASYYPGAAKYTNSRNGL